MSDQQTQPGVILFVDDNADTVQDHRDRLEQQFNRKTYLCACVDAAVRYLEARSEGVCLVVIDLYIPSNWKSLESYAGQIAGGLKSNHGELLGLYLQEKHRHIPFVYLSALTAAHSRADDNPNNVFRKTWRDRDLFIACCTRMLNNKTDRHE